MIPRHVQRTERREKQWRCPCGTSLGLDVQRTEHDEDDLIIRLRVCRNCGEVMATEERPIPLSSFYTRANSHTKRNLAVYRLITRTCAKCGKAYHGGGYSQHVAKSTQHAASLVRPRSNVERAKERVRRGNDYWRNRGIDLSVSNQLAREGQRGPA